MDFLILHEGISALDLDPGQPAIFLKVLLQVPLPGVLHVEVDHEQSAGRLDVALAGVLPPLDVPVSLLEEEEC